MKKILFCAGLLASLTVSAQTKDGGITKQMLQQIEKQNAPTASDRALRNALAANSIDEWTLLDVQWHECAAC